MSDLDILACAICHHGLLVLCLDNDRHTLLRLADSQFCRVESVIFHRHSVKVDVKTVGQLADRYADSAGSKVVRFLDEPCHLRTAEKPLELSLLRSISLLHLTSAGLERLLCVLL